MPKDSRAFAICDLRFAIKPEFPLWAFCPTDEIHLTTAERNCQSGLQCQVLPPPTEWPIGASDKNQNVSH
jgi:hypothetical protein